MSTADKSLRPTEMCYLKLISSTSFIAYIHLVQIETQGPAEGRDAAPNFYHLFIRDRET